MNGDRREQQTEEDTDRDQTENKQRAEKTEQRGIIYILYTFHGLYAYPYPSALAKITVE